jgi:hypothetical protein
MVRERAEPFDLDILLRQLLLEFAALFRDQRQPVIAPGQADLVGLAAGIGDGFFRAGEMDAGIGADAGHGSAQEIAARQIKETVRHG